MDGILEKFVGYDANILDFFKTANWTGGQFPLIYQNKLIGYFTNPTIACTGGTINYLSSVKAPYPPLSDCFVAENPAYKPIPFGDFCMKQGTRPAYMTDAEAAKYTGSLITGGTVKPDAGYLTIPNAGKAVMTFATEHKTALIVGGIAVVGLVLFLRRQ